MINNFSTKKILINVHFYLLKGSFPAIGVEAFCPSFLRAGFLNSIQAPHPVPGGGSLPPRIPAGRYFRWCFLPPYTAIRVCLQLNDPQDKNKYFYIVERKCKWLFSTAGTTFMISNASEVVKGSGRRLCKLSTQLASCCCCF